MNSVREAWTDERLDDLNERIGELTRRTDEGFNRVYEEIHGLRMETKAEIASLRVEGSALRREMTAEIRALHRLILQVSGGVVVTMMVGFLGIIATQL